MTQDFRVLRSWLFVPGDSERKLAKGWSVGADALIVDLEDAVPQAAKAGARATVAAWLRAEPQPVPVWVRVNAGPGRVADLEALAGIPGLAGVV
ncbi:MAG TPA: aldolase/citrate lyase family protein, partial [Casimicrobiaceae bacterium]|nr:aldolase/citrate lyase family protein [Casimicrobiaceae bacterium]